MKFQSLLLILFSLTVYGGELDPYTDLSGFVTDPLLENLRFSNTQKWEARYLAHTRKPPKFLPENWRTRIAAPEPPQNSSMRTRAELDYLIMLQADSTE